MADLFSLLVQSGNSLAAHSAALATAGNNVANANTPGYQRSDVDFQSALAQAFSSGAPTTSQLEQVSFSPQIASTGAMQVDGNTVDINAENADLSENTLDYQALESVMGTRMSILKTAIGSTS